MALLPPVRGRRADAGRGGQTGRGEGNVLYWHGNSVVWRAAETLSLFQNKQMTLDTGGNTAAPHEDVDHCRHQSCSLSPQEEQSFTPSLDEDWEEKLCFLALVCWPGKRGGSEVWATAQLGSFSPWGHLTFQTKSSRCLRGRTARDLAPML